MNPAVEQLSDDKVKLTVDVPAHDVHHAVEHAANDLAASVRIPGFRKGKVPMPILIQRVGKERLYSEAVESHIGGWFWNAATAARVNPIAQPEYEYELPASESENWSFSATVEVQPKPDPADWTQLEVPKVEAEVPAEAVQAELDALQKTVGELVPVEGRPAEDGDTAVIDLIAEDGSAQRDYVVDLGSERLVEEIENGIRGLATGDSREIAYELADGTRRSATVTLKDLKQRVLPPLDDELAKSASEFDTLDELRGEIEGRLRAEVEEELDGLFRAAAVDELVKATKFQAAGPLVEARTRELLNGLARSLQARGIDANTYLQLTGQSPEVLEGQAARRSGAVGRPRGRAGGGRRQARYSGHRRRDPRRVARGRRDRGGHRAVRRRGRRRSRARRHPPQEGPRPRRGRGQADRAGVARSARGTLDARAGAGGRDPETLDPRQQGVTRCL